MTLTRKNVSLLRTLLSQFLHGSINISCFQIDGSHQQLFVNLDFVAESPTQVFNAYIRSVVIRNSKGFDAGRILFGGHCRGKRPISAQHCIHGSPILFQVLHAKDKDVCIFIDWIVQETVRVPIVIEGIVVISGHVALDGSPGPVGAFHRC